MAIAKELVVEVKQDEKERAEVREILAQVQPLYKEAQELASRLSGFMSKFQTFERTKVLPLLNWHEGYERRMKAAEVNIAQMEQAAKTRLSTIEHGHKTLVDD